MSIEKVALCLYSSVQPFFLLIHFVLLEKCVTAVPHTIMCKAQTQHIA